MTPPLNTALADGGERQTLHSCHIAAAAQRETLDGRDNAPACRRVWNARQGSRARTRLTCLGRVCIDRRMPRMQVYLPDELYDVVKTRRLPASELLQRAVQGELRRLDLLEEGDRHLRELVSQVGEPRPAERARARAVAGRIAARGRRKAG